jgi:PKD repeat protein
MRTDPRSVLSGRPQATAPHTPASPGAARRRAAGALGALGVLFALTTTGAWAGTTPQDTGTTTSTEPSPSESPSPDPTPTPTPTPTTEPSPAPSPADAPTSDPKSTSGPSDTSDADQEDSDDSSSDSDSDDNSDEDQPEGESRTDNDPTPSDPSDPATEAPPTTSAPVAFDSAGDLEPQPFIVSGLRFTAAEAAAEDSGGLDAEFGFDVTPGSLTVNFHDESSCSECDVAYWSWDFGDGESSPEQNPTHTYDASGTYDVSLTTKYISYPSNNFQGTVDRVAATAVESPSCGVHDDEGGFFIVYCDTVTHAVTVEGPPNASFTAVPSSGPTPLTVKFTDTSTGDIDSREWTFRGACSGASARTEPAFTQTFITVGECVVTLRVNAPPIPDPGPSFGPGAAAFDPNCNCSTASKTITVTKAPTPKPNDDSDNSDSDDNSDNSDSDNSDNLPGAFIPPNQPPLTEQPSPEPTEPSPAPTTPAKPSKPTPPTEPVNPKPASWITGPDAPGAGITLMILAAVIGAFGGLSMAGRKVALVADRDENTIQRHVEARDAEGWGDRSFTWRFPGHRLIDAASVVLPDRLFRLSPLVGRVTEDGSEFRAMFGTLWLATPLAGVALGLASAAAAGGRALPPSVWLVIAGAVLATFDAFSGALAVVLFAGAALLGALGGATGGPDIVHSLLVILAIGFLWMAIPLIGSAIRPFRRLGDGSLRHRWDSTADGVIAALLCGWVAQKLTQAMDLFAGQKTGLPGHANIVALVVMAAVALRVTMEHFAMSAYPQRLQQVEGEDPPSPLLLSTISGAFIRTAIFGFIGYAFIGSCWQLWLGVGLFLIPQLVDHIREAFPDVGAVRRILPRGVVEIFILVVACTLAARFAMSQGPDQFSGLRLAFLLIAVPPALLGILRALAEDVDESSTTTWPREFLGAVIVAVTAVLAARGWDY